jgi:KDO2-lipid IV(A) lauroyltransferase
MSAFACLTAITCRRPAACPPPRTALRSTRRSIFNQTAIPLKVRLVLLVIRLVGLLPLSLNHLLGGSVGFLLSLIPSKSRRDARVNLKLCFPQLSQKQCRRLLRKTLIETGKTATEAAYFWTRRPERLERLIVEVRGLNAVQEHLESGRGLIVAVPHLGAWELMGLYWARRIRLHSMYRPPRQREFEALLTWVRERSGAELVPATPAGIRRLYRALGEGEVAAILPDQEPPSSGVFAPFFGRPAKTMTLLAKLAQRSGAPVVFAFAERLPWARGYRVHLLRAPDAIADPDPERAAAALNAMVEACVRIAPTQYQWTYRRFRRQPDGKDPYVGQPR